MQDLFYSGTSGLILPVPNKGLYPLEYQDKSRLCFYASLFNSIEINSSFYKVPMVLTVQKWAESVPDNFRFTFKLWREITHVKNLAFNPSDLTRFMQVISNAGTKKGCLLVQFPPGLGIENFDQVKRLLEGIKETDQLQEWKIALEFRSQTWYQDAVYELLDQYKAGIVLHDKLSSGIRMTDQEADFIYLRFHGPQGKYRGSYTDDFLYEYAGYIKEWQEEGKTVYVYFNNTMGDIIKNLNSMNRFIKL